MFDTSVRNLMFDLGTGREIVDAGRVVSKKEASDVIRKACYEFLGLSEKSTNKQIKRALDPHSDKCKQFFEVIEEIIDEQISYGLSENEFFNEFVEKKILNDGDTNEFWVDQDVLLTVSKVSGDHHDLSIQRLGSGQSYHVDTAVYGIKVGENIRLFLTNRKDWSDFIDAVVKAYINKVQTLIASQFANGVNVIPVPSVLTGTGALGSATKAAFDAIIEKVGSANESSVVIMGTKTALKNLTALVKIDWASPAASIKEAVANTGIIGSYEGTPLMEIPQKFTDKTLATPIVDNSKIWIMPAVSDNKFIKFVDQGETELTVDEKGATMDDMQSYEVQRRLGVGTLMARYHGEWTL